MKHSVVIRDHGGGYKYACVEWDGKKFSEVLPSDIDTWDKAKQQAYLQALSWRLIKRAMLEFNIIKDEGITK